VPLRAAFRRFWPLARPLRGVLAAGLVLAALLPAVEAAEIWIFKLIVDDVLAPGELGPLAGYALAMVGLALLGALLSFGDEYIATWVGERFTLALRTRVFAHLQRLEPDALDRRRHGDLLARLTGDVHAVETLLLSALGELVQCAARLVFFAGALALLSWKLALVSLVVVPLFVWAARSFARLSRRAARERRRRSGTLTVVAEEALGNAALVQASNAQGRELARFRRESQGAVDAELAGARIAGVFAPVVDLIELTGALLILALGTWAVSAGELTLGGLLAFLAYLAQLYRPVRDLSQLASSVFEAGAGAERVIELLDTRPAVVEAANARPLPAPPRRVELDGVSYAYPGAPAPALAGLDLVVERGRSVAIVGASGAGKSTLVKLVLRFADPTAGSVRLDGHDLRDLTLASVREHVAVLLQDAPLLAGTVRDNVAYARPEAGDEEVAAALRAAGLEGELTPETPVGERGRALSGGQRRRVAMARALLQDAPVLVLDEPTAGLDAAGTQRLIGPLRELMRDRATLLVTHDLALAAEADDVIVLDQGRVAVAA
jgi:ABC-type multidrug transport system fused ATPase/permease subunit